MKQTYTLNDVAAMCGLTTRTLRNYLNLGLLEGEKTDKGWSFTQEEISDFFSHPSVIPALQTKRTAVVFDFLAARKKKESSLCLILDLPDTDGEALSRQFSHLFNQSAADDSCTFSFENQKGYTRVILTGPPAQVLSLAQQFSHLCTAIL